MPAGIFVHLLLSQLSPGGCGRDGVRLAPPIRLLPAPIAFLPRSRSVPVPAQPPPAAFSGHSGLTFLLPALRAHSCPPHPGCPLLSALIGSTCSQPGPGSLFPGPPPTLGASVARCREPGTRWTRAISALQLPGTLPSFLYPSFRFWLVGLLGFFFVCV